MAYCNLTTDLKTRGRYIQDSIPATLFSSTVLGGYRDLIEDEIHAHLSKAGVDTLPVVQATNPIAFRRLKDLTALGVNAMIEEALETVGRPDTADVEKLSDKFYRQFKEKLDLYADDPVYTLFQGETDLSCMGGRVKTRPIGGVIYSRTANLIGSGEFERPLTKDEDW